MRGWGAARKRASALVFSLVGLGACTTIPTDLDDSGLYLGLVHVKSQYSLRDPASVSTLDVRTAGAWLEVGEGVSAGAGLRARRHVKVPRDCRLVILVADDAQLAGARKMLAELGEGRQACASTH